jgi:hypothetical protein
MMIEKYDDDEVIKEVGAEMVWVFIYSLKYETITFS